ncbi:phage antirepressor KilAC domain-containing protein [Nocardia puris]|uniref:Phage antirepressor YoqD-like protein n=1 Tax=Nocardia puris TaxID=208602 RepID=A0A366CWC1_9NOCA|nr:phage antirepressor KilAC domain-containing protein [Nocardia puris]RBO82120.1 phage antirepressor YoqD-like protein [Nocardia puris]
MTDDTVPDLTSAAARSQRDALAARVDVLDKLGVLRTLPDDMHVTTDMVAEFYEVPKETVFTLVRNNRDEIEADGYQVLTRSAFEETFDTKVPSSASRIALFPRRAVLRVGMLLRDSAVARRVRDMLLDTETSGVPMPTGPELLAHAVLEAQKMLSDRDRQIAQLTEKVAEDAPKVNYVELYVADSDLLKLRTVASANEVGEEWLRDLLLAKGWIYVETESRWSNTKGCMEIRRRYSAYSHKRQYFRPVEVHEAPRFKGEVMHTLKATPAGAEAIARLVNRERVA